MRELAIGVLLIALGIFTGETGLMIEIVLISAWIYFDSKIIGVQRGQVKGICNMSPASWLLASLFVWFITLPLYLSKRSEFKKVNHISDDYLLKILNCYYCFLSFSVLCLVFALFFSYSLSIKQQQFDKSLNKKISILENIINNRSGENSAQSKLSSLNYEPVFSKEIIEIKRFSKLLGKEPGHCIYSYDESCGYEIDKEYKNMQLNRNISAWLMFIFLCITVGLYLRQRVMNVSRSENSSS